MAVNLLFQTATMKLTDNAGNLIQDNLACQVDNVSIPWQMGGDMNQVVFDRYTIYSIGWTNPVPARGNIFVDKTTGAQYNVEGNPAPYQDHLEVQVTLLPAGSVP